MAVIHPEDRYQTRLLSSFDDMVSKQNPVRLIDLIVDKIITENPDDFKRSQESNLGAPYYLTSTLLKLFIYGYFNGISSSRALEKESYRNIEVLWLLGNLHPDHWTISNFRKEHRNIIKKTTQLFRKFLRSNDYIDFKQVAYDGTKIKANTRPDMLTPEQIEKSLKNIEKSIEDYLDQLKLNDIAEDSTEEYLESQGEESINMFLIKKIAELEEKAEKLNTQKMKMEDEQLKRISPSDPDARLMKSRDGKKPGYNVQTVVDSKYHMISYTEVTNEEADQQQLAPLTDSLKDEYDESPDEIIADKGYYNPDDIEQVEKVHSSQVYVSVPKSKSDKSDILFHYDAEKDVYICSEGKKLRLISRNQKVRNSRCDIYMGTECLQCPRKIECTSSKKGRRIRRYKNQEHRNMHKKKMLSKKGKSKSRIRKTIVEHPFGTMKLLMGKIPLLLRGKDKVSTEINLYTIAYNLKRLINIDNMDILFEKVMIFSWK